MPAHSLSKQASSISWEVVLLEECPISCLFLYFKNVFEKFEFFLFFYFKLIYFLVFSDHFDVLMLKIIFKK
jgi:hypothetical protein